MLLDRWNHRKGIVDGHEHPEVEKPTEPTNSRFGQRELEAEAKEMKKVDFESGAIESELLALRTLTTAGVILGMHPDQAAGSLCDLGLLTKTPFAVVPCCVYSPQFPSRRLQPCERYPKGKPVANYEDLCRFILEKRSSIRSCVLPFQGKNRVFYWAPEFDLPASAS